MFNKERDLQEIQGFLDEYKVPYIIKEPGWFVLFSDAPIEKRRFEIRYVESLTHAIAYPKYDIKGVDQDWFYRLSRKAEANNSFYYWIKDFEWNDAKKREVMKSQILHVAGLTKNKIYARDCIVKEVPAKICRAFEAENCFYGKRGASLNLGLYLKKDKGEFKKDQLIQVYTMGHNFFGKTNDIIEVIRVGTIKYAMVIGGPSKLLSYFIENYKTMIIGKHEIKVRKLKFYSDFDHNIGSSMDSLDFKLDSYSKGGFINLWLEEGGKVLARSPMHHKEIMQKIKSGKCISIPNSGTKVYMMYINQ